MLIYLLRNTVNGKGYVGQTLRTLEARMYQHQWESTKERGYIIHKAIAKYGWDKFTVTLLKECSSKEELNAEEVRLIAELGTRIPKGYNWAEGGNSAGLHTKASKRKMSEQRKGKPLHPNTLAALIKANTNRDISEETHKKLSEAQRGNKKGLGRFKDDDEKRRIGEKQRGDKNHAAKLNWEIVNAMREEYTNGTKVLALAEKYSIRSGYVSRIVNYRMWVPEGMEPNKELIRPKKEDAVKLTWELVTTLRNDFASGLKIIELHRKYNIPPTTLGRIVFYKSWVPEGFDLSTVPKRRTRSVKAY